jgi:hypothetical protein
MIADKILATIFERPGITAGQRGISGHQPQTRLDLHYGLAR